MILPGEKNLKCHTWYLTITTLCICGSKLSGNLYYPHLGPIHFEIRSNTNKFVYLIFKPKE